jgi:anaerobic carbon-monoxide dehydrogenase iron sulfur subunit
MRVLAVKQELCNGCGACETTCAMTFFEDRDRDRSSIRVEGRSGRGYSVAFCDQCGECIAVCPTQALYRSKSGIVRLRARDCVGCLACAGFCPTLVMYAVLDDLVPIKCIACAKCVDVCPTGALFMADVNTPPASNELTRSIRALTGADARGH